MKWFVCVLCLLVASADTAFARGGRGGGGGIFRGGLLHRGNGGGSSSDSLNAVVDKAPTYPVEHQLLHAINEVRKQYGLCALVLDRTLHLRTRQHCGWMANTRQMIHGVGHPENIAMGQSDVDNVMTAWMNSSGHRANILNPGYTKVGLSGYLSPDGTPFWCQQFESGAIEEPKPAPTEEAKPTKKPVEKKKTEQKKAEKSA